MTKKTTTKTTAVRTARKETTFTNTGKAIERKKMTIIIDSASEYTIFKDYRFETTTTMGYISEYGANCYNSILLTVGDYKVAIYYFDDGDITLDSETQNAYLSDGSFCNDSIYTDEFPLLAPGNNSISWSGGITSVTIIPRWWTL